MKRYTHEQVRNFARYAKAEMERRQRPVLVWWDLIADEFLCIRSDGDAGRLLNRRLDDETLRSYVGMFEPQTSKAEIEEALTCHARGMLSGRAA